MEGTLLRKADVACISELLKLVDTLYCQTGSERLLFRGVGDYRYRLEPSLSRYMKPAKPKGKFTGPENAKARIEWKDRFKETERNLLSEFRRLAEPVLQEKPTNSWEWLAVAQHHGIPTRLLDWSTNLLVALWFAVAKSGRNDQVDGGLWVYAPKGPIAPSIEKQKESDWLSPALISEEANHSFGEPLSIRKTRIFDPRRLIPRIQMQSGLFTVHQFMPDNGRYDLVPLEQNSAEKHKVSRIRIKAQDKNPIRTELEKHLGLEVTKIYPDVDGIAGSLRDAFEPSS